MNFSHIPKFKILGCDTTSTNLNICNFLLHGKTTIAQIEQQLCYSNIFFDVSLYY
jgi:hypothetical protein